MTGTIELKVTYRGGQATAGYLYLVPPKAGSVDGSKRLSHGIVADFDGSGRCVGLEFTAPRLVNREVVGGVLSAVGVDPVPWDDVDQVVDKLNPPSNG
jgi:hypothetical protein